MIRPGAGVAIAWLAHELGRDLQQAVRLCGGVGELLSLSDARLAATLCLGAEDARRIRTARTAFGDAHTALRSLPIETVELGGHGYPTRLAAIHDPPFALFRAGPLDVEHPPSRPVVAIVGARRASAFGIGFAERLGRDLAARGAVIVSGLALGIDAAAHRGALDAGGDTIAVVGCGVESAYPRRHRALHAEILERGAVVSEYWPGTEPAPWRFPARNRIIAGMADLVVVVEAGSRSGSLITADFALDIGRQVLAVPGVPGSPTVSGCHALLRVGAGLCESADDVCEELGGLDWDLGPGDHALVGPAADVHEAISREGLRPDEVAARVGRPIAEVAGILSLLEMDGLATREGGRFHALGGSGCGV